jgi:hypothetical protein
VAGPEQQQGLPGRPDLGHQQRHLDLLRRQELDRPKVKELAADIQHASFPVGPVGVPTESHLFFNQMVFKYTKYPKAAKEFVRFMMEEEQFDPGWPAPAATSRSRWRLREEAGVDVDPKNTPYRDSVKNMRPAGYAGKLGYASAGAGADFIVANMVAEAVSGSKTPKEAPNAPRSAPSATTRSESLTMTLPAVQTTTHVAAPQARVPRCRRCWKSSRTTATRSGWAFMLPAAVLLLLFLTYPLGLGSGSASPTPRSAAAASG